MGLFDRPTRSRALARNSDPRTSHNAAQSVDDALPHMEKLVLDVLMARGQRGGTWDDVFADLHERDPKIAKASVSPRFRPLWDKRLIELRDKHGVPIRIEESDIRQVEAIKRPGVSARGQLVWFAVRGH